MVLIQEIEEEPEQVVPVVPDNKNKEIQQNNEVIPKKSESESSEKPEDEAEKAAREFYTPEEEKKMMEYVHEFTRSKETPDMVEKFIGPHPNTNKFWRGYIEATGSSRQPHSLINKYQRMVPRLHLMQFPTEFKMDIYYSLTLPIPHDYLREIKGEVRYCMDDLNHLEAFEMIRQIQQEKPKKTPKKGRRSSIAVKQDTKTPAKVTATPVTGGSVKKPKTYFSEAEDVLICNFLLTKMTNPQTKAVDQSVKPKSIFLWREFLGEKGEDAAEVRRHVSHYDTLKKNLHKMPFDDQRKLNLYYGLRIPINAEFLASLRQKTNIEIGEDGCLLKPHCLFTRIRLY